MVNSSIVPAAHTQEEELPSYKEMMKKLAGQQDALVRILQTTDGQHALEFLKAKFGGDLVVKGDPYLTHVRIGEHNVVSYLSELRGQDR